MKMQAKKLTAEQIETLYAFTRQHYVEYYDVQTELVDHLANAIEAAWEENPKLTFNEILHAEFKKFGIFGFMDVVEKRQAAMGKKYNKMVWHYVKGYFKLPKVVMTAVLTLLYFLVLHISTGYQHVVVVSSAMILFIASLIFQIRLLIKNKKINKATGKRWMLRDIIFNTGVISFMIAPQFSHILWRVSDKAHENLYIQIGFSCLMVFLAVLHYVIIFVIPSKADEHLKATYPEYALEVS